MDLFNIDKLENLKALLISENKDGKIADETTREVSRIIDEVIESELKYMT